VNDQHIKAANAYLDGARRTLQRAEQIAREEAEKLANSGRLFETKSRSEAGHTVTRYHGDIAATFAPFTIPGRKIQVTNPRRGGGA
jgi:hypothetical protein